MDGFIPVSHFVYWVLFHAFLLSVFINHLFKKSSSEEHPQIVKQFGSRSVQQNVGPDLAFCKDNKQKAIAVLTH